MFPFIFILFLYNHTLDDKEIQTFHHKRLDTNSTSISYIKVLFLCSCYNDNRPIIFGKAMCF